MKKKLKTFLIYGRRIHRGVDNIQTKKKWKHGFSKGNPPVIDKN